jgi:hypothetical protein
MGALDGRTERVSIGVVETPGHFQPKESSEKFPKSLERQLRAFSFFAVPISSKFVASLLAEAAGHWHRYGIGRPVWLHAPANNPLLPTSGGH